MRILLILVLAGGLAGCAYESKNLMHVKAKKFSYGLIACDECELTFNREMDTKNHAIQK